ncbi:hypothetical protein GSY69_08420 [Brevibacterium sp. 5221]|uniref:Uncharacterized protein n=1 Tax=Brevibacterium rongguiense TaxID=2695267 RepID=A0A6N9H7D8_9MICO|nr:MULTISPECIES: hypothetical protein [Brevibacterium]MYM19988.1 hypothetical protein [Brevibacterium rongguiense]WAL40044.1 hypothetical protein BRM1_12555 [Brevibacterium sp. BRM-1]
MAQQRERRADAWLIGTAVALMSIGALALAAVVIVGVAGGVPSVALTWVGMIAPPIAFIVMVVAFVRLIGRRRRPTAQPGR